MQMDSGMPKMFSSPEEKAITETTANTATSIVENTLWFAIFLQFFLRKVISKVWPLFNAIQLCFLMLLLQIDLPGNVVMVLSKLKESLGIGLSDIGNAANSTASETEIPPMSLTEVLLYIILPSVVVIIGTGCFLYHYMSKCPNIKDVLREQRDKIFFSGLIRPVMCMFLGLCAKAKVAHVIAGISPVSDLAQKLFLGVIGAIPLAVAIFMVVVPDKKLAEPGFRKHWGTLYAGVNLKKGLAAKMLMPVFFTRRLILVILLAPSINLVHISLIVVSSIVTLCYYIEVKPWTDPAEYRNEMFNEGFLLFGLSYFIFLFSYFIVESWIRFTVGWVFVGMLGFDILVNTANVAIVITKEIIA